MGKSQYTRWHAKNDAGEIKTIHVHTPVIKEWQEGGETKRAMGPPRLLLDGDVQVNHVSGNDFLVPTTGEKLWTVGDDRPDAK